MLNGRCSLFEKFESCPLFVGGAIEERLPVPGLDAYFRAIIEHGVRESCWFRTAPADLRATATIQILGIETRKFYGFGTALVRPTLIAECNCGGEVQKFSLLLDNTEEVEAIPG